MRRENRGMKSRSLARRRGQGGYTPDLNDLFIIVGLGLAIIVLLSLYVRKERAWEQHRREQEKARQLAPSQPVPTRGED